MTDDDGQPRPESRAARKIGAGVLQSPAPRRRFQRDVPTETPPPYFPQNPLTPGDEKAAKKLRLTFYGCGVLLLLAAVGAVVGIVYLIRSFV